MVLSPRDVTRLALRSLTTTSSSITAATDSPRPAPDTPQVYHCRRQRSLYPPLRYLLLGLLPGATVAGVGLVCYALLETEENYKYTHSAWHCCIAVSILFLLPPRRELADSYSLDDGGANGAGGGSGSSTGKVLRVTAGGSQQTVNTSSDSERGVADGHR